MSWEDDRELAYSDAAELGIETSQLDDWHAISNWTWEDIADRLEIQTQYADYYRRDEMPPDWLMAEYDSIYDLENVPEWMKYYHD